MMYLHGMRWQAREWGGRRVGLLRVYCTSCVAVRHATFTCNNITLLRFNHEFGDHR